MDPVRLTWVRGRDTRPTACKEKKKDPSLLSCANQGYYHDISGGKGT